MNFHTRWSFNKVRFQFEALIDCLHNTMGVLVCYEQMKSQFNLGLSYWIRAIIEKQNNWFEWCEQCAEWLNEFNGFVCFDYFSKAINVPIKRESFLCKMRESFQVADPIIEIWLWLCKKCLKQAFRRILVVVSFLWWEHEHDESKVSWLNFQSRISFYVFVSFEFWLIIKIEINWI